jgi:hypothetical protein
MMNSVKRYTFLLVALFFIVLAHAQTSDQMTERMAEIDSVTVSASQIYFDSAEVAYAQFFMQKTEQTVNKDELYKVLMDSFKWYMKCIEEDYMSHLSVIKVKMRQLRAECEIAGIYYSSNGDNSTASKFLECYLNIPHLPFFEGEQFPRNGQYPAYVFIVAAESHNSRDYAAAVNYLQEYIELGDKHNQQTCYEFLAADLEILERYDDEAMVLDEGIMNYPRSLKMLKQAIMLFVRRNNKEKAEEMLNKALALAPNDPNLKLFKASIDDQNGRFAEALPIYKEFYDQNPNNISIIKQLAFCHYNLAGALINESNSATSQEQFKALRGGATEHFNQAIVLLEPISKLPEAVRDDQRIIFALSDALTQVGRGAEADGLREQAQQNVSLQVPVQSEVKGAPNFNEWYQPKLEKILAEWERRGEFEPADEYQKRVNPETRKALIVQSRNSLEQEYIQEYSHTYNLDDLTIKPYDPDHQTYRIQTRQGDIYLKVPIADDEAKNFKENWSGVKIQTPQFKVDKSGKLLLSKALFATPDGKSYLYDANEQLTYGKIRIARPEWNDDDLLATIDNDNSPVVKREETVVDEPINVGESTVDVNVPKNKDRNDNTFALIIANEKYKNIDDVPFALNDGRSFKRYCEEVLGVPSENIKFKENATVNEMIDVIDQIKDFEKVYENMKLLVYFSGHGLPDPHTNESYLLPVDASPRNISTGYKLSRFYQELTAYHPASVTVFLDACFSGTKKDGVMMDKEARGVIITPREETPTTNMVVFSACTGNETAYPYHNQKHGLFTYFLLKKLQEDKGKTNYKNLSEYISKNVKQHSLRLNGKIQSPTTHSALPASEWNGWRLDK